MRHFHPIILHPDGGVYLASDKVANYKSVYILKGELVFRAYFFNGLNPSIAGTYNNSTTDRAYLLDDKLVNHHHLSYGNAVQCHIPITRSDILPYLEPFTGKTVNKLA